MTREVREPSLTRLADFVLCQKYSQNGCIRMIRFMNRHTLGHTGLGRGQGDQTPTRQQRQELSSRK